jgi:hypothetical protein
VDDSLPQTTCPLCQGAYGVICRKRPAAIDGEGFHCGACGRFEISRTALADCFNDSGPKVSALATAALRHAVRRASDSGRVVLTSDRIESIRADARLPSPAMQAINLIRVIGDHLAESGQGYFFDDVTDAPLVGAFNAKLCDQLRVELEKKGIIVSLEEATIPNNRGVGMLSGRRYGLTLDGWERYEAERRGQVVGTYGFMAMKFGDAILDGLVEAHIKPGVKTAIGIDVVEMRGVAQAGVIDNIMRAQIRDSAFVLVDLTHDNAGAYWEAGYAEGLSKPVIYLCERSKFEAAKTHFDTNHCTTVLWTEAAPETFIRDLVATLRRSLNLFGESRG